MDKYKAEGDKIYERVISYADEPGTAYTYGKGPRIETWKLICTCVDDETADEIAGILNAHEWAS